MNATIVLSGECHRCGDIASRTSEPWDNQFRCTEGCRCTMQGCCPREITRTIQVPSVFSVNDLPGI